MSKSEKKISLHALCEITSSKRVYVADYQAEGVPFYRGKEIIEKHKGNLDVSTELFISEDKFAEFKNKFGAPQPGDLLLTSVGTLGVPYVVKPGEVFYFKDGNLTWFRQFKNLDGRFLYYWLISPQGKAELKKCTIGSSQPAFTIVLLKDMEIELPALLIQRKISSLLSSYDDLIENNNKRIKILEEMAQMIYREWFVNFRFPGHKKVKMVKSKLGMIPEGWEVKSLGDICTIVMGQSPKSEFYNEDGNGLPFHQGVTDFGDRFPTARIYCTVQNRIAEDRDILFSVRAPVGRINIANKKMVIGRGLCAIRSRTGNQSFVFQQLKDKFQETDTMGGGTIFKSVTKEDVHGILMIAPSLIIVNKFEDIIKPIFQDIEILTNKNNNLRQTRDLLLPKLISGEIDVEKVDINTESVNPSLQ